MPYPDFKLAPDFSRLETVFRRGVPDRVPFIELFIDEPAMVAIREAPFSSDPRTKAREVAELFYRLGYDYVPCRTSFLLTFGNVSAEDTAELPMAEREWITETEGVVETWEDFERYEWLEPKDEHFAPIEYAAEALPEGMKLIPHGPGGVLENVMWIMGYSPLSYAMVDEPDLVQAMFDRVGETLLKVFDRLASYEAVGAVFLGDDMGFKTQTLLSPDALRKYVFPWQKRLAETVHARGKPFLLHSCGNLEAVMDDLIDYVGIDGKHSFEDVIMPIEEVKKRWGDRVALLGGVDVDTLCRRSPDEVRARTREILEACMPGGGYALGSGNTVTNYMPIENYLAMLEEGRRYGVYA